MSETAVLVGYQDVTSVKDALDRANKLAFNENTINDGDIMRWSALNSRFEQQPLLSQFYFAQDTAPSSPLNGTYWVDTTTMTSYIWDDDQGFWIQAS